MAPEYDGELADAERVLSDKNAPPPVPSTKSVQPVDRRVLYDEYCSRMASYLRQEEITQQTYSREFIYFMRNVIREFKTTPCPLTDEQLSAYPEIDKATMSPNVVDFSKRIKKLRLESKIIKKPQQPRIQNPNRHAEAIFSQPRGENAWIPPRARLGSEPSKPVRYERRIRGILNKITESTKADIGTKLINMMPWRNEKLLQIMVDLIFKKSVEEPLFAKLYSDLCLSIHQAELRAEPHLVQEHKMTKFFYAIISTAQISFENQMVYGDLREDEYALEAKIAGSTNEAEIAKLSEDLENLRSKNHQITTGTIRFITHLFRIGLLRQNILQVIIKDFIKSAENSRNQLRKELDIEYAVLTIEGVGPTIAEKGTDPEKDLLKQLIVHFARDEMKKSVSNRVRFMILDIVDLQARNWKPKERNSPLNFTVKNPSSPDVDAPEQSLVPVVNDPAESPEQDVGDLAESSAPEVNDLDQLAIIDDPEQHLAPVVIDPTEPVVDDPAPTPVVIDLPLPHNNTVNNPHNDDDSDPNDPLIDELCSLLRDFHL